MSAIELILRDGSDSARFAARPGDTVLDVARREGVDLEGACGGQMACATCHVYVEEGWASKLPRPQADELDMLSLAEHWRPNSRLGCQIRLTKDLNGLTLALPPV